MIYNNIEFHNVEKLTEVEGIDGLGLQRVPEDVRRELSIGGQRYMLSPAANVELRFVLESESVEITLSASDSRGLRMFVFWSGFREREFYQINEEPTTIKLEMSEKYKRMDSKHCKKSGFSKKLVRIMFAGFPDTTLYYHGISKGIISVPTEKDKPKKKLLSYGTSITHGARATAPYFTYPYQTARNLEMDVINLGSAGTAFCEKAMTDYIASRQDWDIATLSLSVNMYASKNFTFETFKERTRYMIETIAANNPTKPIFCITLFPFFDDVEVYEEDSEKNAEGYRQAIRDVVHSCGLTNVYLIEGEELLTDFTLLAPDLIHPNDMGMVQIGANLARKIEGLIY